VDDDPLQAFARKTILEKRFSDVLRVSDAAEALCLVEQPQFAGCLSLVVSRDSLAGIGGPALVAELHTRMPFLPVLVLGDADGDQTQYPGDYVCFLPRPILPDKMLALASQMMAENQRKTA
jgi:DNA-binding NtrC family response regulator